jgi:hypothetical protein
MKLKNNALKILSGYIKYLNHLINTLDESEKKEIENLRYCKDILTSLTETK